MKLSYCHSKWNRDCQGASHTTWKQAFNPEGPVLPFDSYVTELSQNFRKIGLQQEHKRFWKGYEKAKPLYFHMN